MKSNAGFVLQLSFNSNNKLIFLYTVKNINLCYLTSNLEFLDDVFPLIEPF